MVNGEDWNGMSNTEWNIELAKYGMKIANGMEGRELERNTRAK